MTAAPIWTLDIPGARRQELDHLTEESWPAMSDASPIRSALVGLLRAYRLEHIDVEALRAEHDHAAIELHAERLGVPFALLQAALLHDAGAVTVVTASDDTDVAALVAGMPSLCDRDRRELLRDLDGAGGRD